METLPVLKDLEVTAMMPQEMMVAQHKLIDWCMDKITSLVVEANELKEATDQAKQRKWKHTTLQSQYNKSLKRISYYEKVKAALEAGYCIVPNFEVDIFAIRTKRDEPKYYVTTSRWGRAFKQESNDVPAGEGEYKDSMPIVCSNRVDEKTVHYYPDSWQDVEFPLNMSKPIIMEATGRAMALKIFDQIGVFPGRGKKDDPIITGQIINKNGAQTKKVSFLIAWHLNTNVL